MEVDQGSPLARAWCHRLINPHWHLGEGQVLDAETVWNWPPAGHDAARAPSCESNLITYAQPVKYPALRDD